MTENLTHYRVWMHTKPAPGVTYYSGYVDVYALDEEEAGHHAKAEAHRRALHTGMVVDRVEMLRGGPWR